MTQNPWQVDSIQAFVYINCPECTFKTKEEEFFKDHAVASHPMCSALFGHADIIIQEVTVEDQKSEYYIEVRAEEVPSESELASALASLEEPSEDNIEIFDDTSVHSIVESDTKSVGQSNASNFEEVSNETQMSLSGNATDSDTSKPKISYAKLISEALLNSINGMSILPDIYKSISARHPYYQMHMSSWQKSVRQKLALDKSFVKCINVSTEKPYWKLSENLSKSVIKNLPEEELTKMKTSIETLKIAQTKTESDRALENMLNNLDDYTPKITTAKNFKKEKASFAQMLDGLADPTFKCYYCDKVFCKRKFLDIHHKNHLDDKGHFPCKHCTKTFPRYMDIKPHVVGTHTPAFCKDCDKSFFSHTSYQRHRQTIHIDQSIKKFKCDLCTFESHHIRYIKMHKQNVHVASGSHNHVCKECNGGFSNKGSLQNHFCNKSKKEPEEQLYKCPKCDSIFNHSTFLNHYRRTHGGLPPGYEDVKKYVCDKCSEEFLYKAGLRQHKKNQMCIEGSKEIYCDKCIPKVFFESPTIFIRHYREIHNGYPPMYEHLPKYLCSHCPRICISEHQLKKHQSYSHSNKLKQPTKPKPRQHCAICKKEVSSVRALKNHMIMMHENGENSAQFQCETCNKRMPTATKLKEHFRDVHTKVTCEICHEVQYNWYYLKRHKASAHGMIPSGYTKCPHCALVFRTNCTLLKHINSKHR